MPVESYACSSRLLRLLCLKLPPHGLFKPLLCLNIVPASHALETLNPSRVIVYHFLHAFRRASKSEHVGDGEVVENCVDELCTCQLRALPWRCAILPAGRIAFDSATNSVVRSEDRNDGGAWGTARLKFDLVAIIEV